MTELSNEQLQQVLQALADQIQGNKKDGLITYRRAKSVYVNHKTDESSALLYHYDREQGKQFIDANAIRGQLTSCTTQIKNEGDKKMEAEKLVLYIESSEENYRFETGISTVTAKSILLDLANMSSTQLAQPITIAFKRGDEVVFSKVIESPNNQDRQGMSMDQINSHKLVDQARVLLGLDTLFNNTQEDDTPDF